MPGWMKRDFHLTPAYGRDYRSKDEVAAAWHQGKDFVLATTGQYCSKRDLAEMPGQVWVRYGNLRKVMRVQ